MIKYLISLAVILGTTVAIVAAIATEAASNAALGNVTIVYKDKNWKMGGPIKVERCALEDCSDTPQS